MARTLMHEAGVSLKLTQEILAHASKRTTRAIYPHSMRRTHDDSADKIAIPAGLAPASMTFREQHRTIQVLAPLRASPEQHHLRAHVGLSPTSFCRATELALGRPMVLRANEGEDPPQIIVRRDGTAHGRHRSHDIFQTRSDIAPAEQSLTPICDQPEERVIIAAVDPHAIRQRRTDSPATCAAMTPAARRAAK
jgi:hypothetical protein